MVVSSSVHKYLHVKNKFQDNHSPGQKFPRDFAGGGQKFPHWFTTPDIRSPIALYYTIVWIPYIVSSWISVII